MTINELKESGKKRWDGPFKHRAASMVHLGMADARELCRELKINRNLLRRWLRWDWRQRVLKLTKPSLMKENDKAKELRAQIAELEKLLEKERLRSEAYEILLDIGKEKYGIDLRKKNGAKRSEG